MVRKRVLAIVAMVAALATTPLAQAVDIATVPVGNVGNPGEQCRLGWYGDPTYYGGVDYAYNIGKYEVSNGEYCEFLNAVATVGDPHGLYNWRKMGGGWRDIGGISRTGLGTAGDPWIYSPRPNRANRPVNYVSFWDACRFANWLHNGQPTGGQGPGTTENGAYLLNGVTSPPNASISREADWKWAVTSEDEWYKAAYHKNDGVTSNYFRYPTAGDTAPTAEAPPGTDMTNGSANYKDGGHVDPTYYTTECGAYGGKPSDSRYGTFDQGGNVREWNEAIISGSFRGLRGGSFYSGGGYMPEVIPDFRDPAYETHDLGFRVSVVPEPATLSLLAFGGLALLRRRSRMPGVRRSPRKAGQAS